jgi:hypothetical protein
LFPLFATSAIDTNSKLATGIIDTGSEFATGNKANSTGGKIYRRSCLFATSVVDTNHNLLPFY